MWPPASSTRANTTSSSALASSSSLQVGAVWGAPPAWGGHEEGSGSSQAVRTEILRFESCNSPVGKSPQEGKAVRGLWPWSLCQGGSGASLLCLEQDLCGGTAQEGLQSAAIPLGAPGPGTGMGALPPTLHRQWAPCQQQQDQAEGLPPSCMEITLWRGCSCWITHFSVLFPNASPDYRVTMSLSQGTALFCVFLLPTKRQMTLPPWLAGAADADEKTAERT